MLQQSQQAQPTTTVNAITTSPFASTSQALPNTGKHPNLWILDTRATNHISFHLANFTSYQSIVPISVSLPNGSHLTASVSGTIVISPSLTLYNVLYIPNFHVNLISVTKLTTNNDYSLNFSSTLCNILQNHSKQMISTTKLHRGLYVMDSNAFHNSCNSIVSNSFEMWHLRLGHLSNSGMKYMSKQFPVIPCKNNMDPCDSCHLAKLKKLPFPNSFTNTHAPFELLHADLWGPLATDSILGHR
jgi:histone deacetylase 1/2